MQDSVNGSGRTKVILILLLLATCYVADWSDDTYSFAVASRYTAFENANPKLKALIGGGGSMNSSSMLSAMAQANSASQEKQSSALESVFGTAWGASGSNSSGSSQSSARLNSPYRGNFGGDNNTFGNSLTNRADFGLNASGLSRSGLGSSSAFSSGLSGVSVSPY